MKKWNMKRDFCVGFSELRVQDRIRLHIQFFSSLTLLSAVSISWYLLVHLDFLSNQTVTDTVLYRNPVSSPFITAYNIIYQRFTRLGLI